MKSSRCTTALRSARREVRPRCVGLQRVYRRWLPLARAAGVDWGVGLGSQRVHAPHAFAIWRALPLRQGLGLARAHSCTPVAPFPALLCVSGLGTSCVPGRIPMRVVFRVHVFVAYCICVRPSIRKKCHDFVCRRELPREPSSEMPCSCRDRMESAVSAPRCAVALADPLAPVETSDGENGLDFPFGARPLPFGWPLCTRTYCTRDSRGHRAQGTHTAFRAYRNSYNPK